jgi:1,4-alpha-glucan branching enzyme
MSKAKQATVTTKSVAISCAAPLAKEVFVAGTFNDWNPSANPLAKESDGTWAIKLRLPIGDYEYKFIVDGQWRCKPDVDEFDPALWSDEDCVKNVHGTLNRKLIVR